MLICNIVCLISSFADRTIAQFIFLIRFYYKHIALIFHCSRFMLSKNMILLFQHRYSISCYSLLYILGKRIFLFAMRSPYKHDAHQFLRSVEKISSVGYLLESDSIQKNVTRLERPVKNCILSCGRCCPHTTGNQANLPNDKIVVH